MVGFINNEYYRKLVTRKMIQKYMLNQKVPFGVTYKILRTSNELRNRKGKIID